MGLSASIGTHCISIVCEALYFSFVLKFYCFLSFVVRYSFSVTHRRNRAFEQTKFQTF